jgi:exosortase A-associated hydrolase 2
MVSADQIVARPELIAGPSGPLFAVYYAPREGAPSNGTVLYCPPFAEEMNRSRRMAALQARALAAAGFGTLVLDFFGTGDSAGDFRDASLSRWLGDVMAAADWLAARSGKTPLLWGLRLGALIAVAAAARQPGRFKRLLLWQPVTDGKVMLTQFLRVRVAATMADGGAGEKVEHLRARFAAGESVEVAGYELAAALAQEIDGLRMDALVLAGDTSIDWFEVAAEASDRLLPGSQRLVEQWQKSGHATSAAVIVGDPFWSLQEITLAPGLIAATTAALAP